RLRRGARPAADRREEAQPVAQLRGGGAIAAHPLAHVLVERTAPDELHREEVLAVGRAGLVERGDVRVDEARERLRLAAEEAQLQIVHDAAAADDLQRDTSLRVALLGFVND